MPLSHFDEKSGIISYSTTWGSWWQTVFEVHISVNLPDNTKSREVKVSISASDIECTVHNQTLFKGQLFDIVHPDDSVWTIEDGCVLNIILSKAKYEGKDTLWEALLKDGSYQPDALTLHEMRKKLDLEKFQIENPGMDFSRAKLSKTYDKIPGLDTTVRKEGQDNNP